MWVSISLKGRKTDKKIKQMEKEKRKGRWRVSIKIGECLWWNNKSSRFHFDHLLHSFSILWLKHCCGCCWTIIFFLCSFLFLFFSHRNLSFISMYGCIYPYNLSLSWMVRRMSQDLASILLGKGKGK